MPLIRWRRPDLTADEIAMLDQIDAIREVEAIHGSWSHADRTDWEAMLEREAEVGSPASEAHEAAQAASTRPRRKGRSK